MMRAIEDGDPAGQALADAEVGGLPGDFFAEADQARGDSGDGALVGPGGRPHVKVDVAREVETDFQRLRFDRRGAESGAGLPGFAVLCAAESPRFRGFLRTQRRQGGGRASPSGSADVAALSRGGLKRTGVGAAVDEAISHELRGDSAGRVLRRELHVRGKASRDQLLARGTVKQGGGQAVANLRESGDRNSASGDRVPGSPARTAPAPTRSSRQGRSEASHHCSPAGITAMRSP
jgi:hypothetical protein